MRVDALHAAISEAERFLRRCRAVEILTIVPDHGKPWDTVRDNTAESAACKRASLDLTMVLAELRKP